MRTIKLLFFILLLAAVQPCKLKAEDNYVLFISSYSVGQTWPVIIENTFRARMEREKSTLHINSEYLNCNHFSSPDVWLETMRMILRNYSATPPKMVVLLADEAWVTFRKAYNGQFGDDIPVILCGIKEHTVDFDRYRDKDTLTSADLVSTPAFAGKYNLTGVLERPEIEKNIRLMKRLQPDINEITLVSDNRFYGVYTTLRTQEIMAEKFPDMKLNLLDGRFIGTDTLYEQLGNLSPRSSVLLASWFLNLSSAFENYAWVHQRISTSANRPVFVLFDWGALRDIFAGGCYIDARNYGFALTEMVRKIDAGMHPSSIPFVVNPGGTRCYLNWDHIEKYAIPRSYIPGETLYYNRPLGFFEKNRTLILFILIIVPVVIVGLLITLLRSRRLRKELARSKDQVTLSLHNQQLLSDALYLFLRSGEEEKAVIATLQKVLGEFKADRTYVYEFDERAFSCINLYEVVGSFVPSRKEVQSTIPCEMLPDFLSRMNRDEIYYKNDILRPEDGKEPDRQELFLSQGASSQLIAPLFVNKKLWGFAGIDYMKRNKVWEEQDIIYLRSLSQVLSIGIEHFRTETQKLDMERVFSYASENAEVGVGQWNFCTGKGFATEQWFRNFGETTRNMDEVIGIYSNVHPDDRKEMQQFVNDAIHNKAKNLCKAIRVRHGDEWRWLKYHGMLKSYDPEHNNVIVVGINIDIDNLKKAEESLIAAKARAEESDKLKSAFLANMSHEIRTPLNAIVGFSNILTEIDDKKERRECMRIIETNNELLLQLINDILDLSRIEAGVLEFSSTRVELLPLMQELDAVYALRAKKPVEIRFVAEEAVPCTVIIDRNRLRQVITNLLNNAIKFTVTGYIHFGYTVDQEEVRFYVADTGKGIPEEKRKNIFQRFIKLNNFAQGTGLGLSICATLVELWGGKIGVNSKVGIGSTFWFTVPRNATPLEETETVPQQPEAETPPPPVQVVCDGKPLILVAEDIEHNYLLLQTLLQEEYRLIRAYDGIEAVEMTEQYHPHLILMDIRMPRMDGIEATRRIRTFSQVPVIAVSASAYDTDKKIMMQAGANDFVTKPFNAQQLKDVIGRYVSCR